MKDLFTKIKTFFKSLKRYPEASLFYFKNDDSQNFLASGVCAGIAYRLKTRVVVVRLAFLLLMLYGWVFLAWLLVYAALWMFVPKAEVPEDYKQVCEKELLPYDLYRIPAGGCLGGIFSGLAYKFKLHPVVLLLMRIGYVALYILLGYAIFFLCFFSLYFAAWILFPPREKPEDYDSICKLTKESLKRIFK